MLPTWEYNLQVTMISIAGYDKAQTWCSCWFWYPKLRHWAIVIPWKITTLKYESSNKILSAAMEATSNNAGAGSALNEYDINDGWIITAALLIFSLSNNMRKYAVSSGLLLKTCQHISTLTKLNEVWKAGQEVNYNKRYLYKLWASQIEHKLREKWKWWV